MASRTLNPFARYKLRKEAEEAAKVRAIEAEKAQWAQRHQHEHAVAEQAVVSRARSQRAGVGEQPQPQADPATRLTASLAIVQGVLEKLRSLSTQDVHFCPMLNESQRLVQMLRDAAAMVDADQRHAWE